MQLEVLLLSRFVCISPALYTTPCEHWVVEDDMQTSNTMSTGFSAIMQSIDLGVAWKGQVNLRLLLAEDSIPAEVFSLAPSLFLFVLTCLHGWTEPWLFLVFGCHYNQGKWGLQFRIKAHSGLMAITLEISSRSSIGSTDSSHPHDKMKFLVSFYLFYHEHLSSLHFQFCYL